MNFSIPGIVEFYLVALSSVFVIVDPIGCIPTFLVVTQGLDRPRRRRIALRASVFSFILLTAFAAAGTLIFKAFGITLPAFKIAGGILLFLVAIDMLEAKRSQTQESDAERSEAVEREDPSLIPLTIPMLAGPAAISTVMVLMGQSRYWWQAVPVFVAILVTAASTFLILAAADAIRRVLKATGIRVLMRVMGLVLAALAVQFVLNGLADVGLFHRG
ncbi:MAG: MarC family protein [Acidobacteria bacterium]|nr:MarC family protein [Acidobacteriota bacterium]